MACKQAYIQILNEGYTPEELAELDFGNLDRYAVEGELEYHAKATSFNCEGFELVVLHKGSIGIDWDFPIKPGDKVSTKAIQAILSNFVWPSNED